MKTSIRSFNRIKLTTLFLLISFIQVNAAGYAQAKINLQLKETSIQQILKAVEKQTKYRFVYHTATLPRDKKISIAVKDGDLSDVLAQALKGTGLEYEVKEDNLVVIFASGNSSSVAEDVIIRGKITGEGNLPLAGASVKVSGTNTGTVSDNEGAYSLKIPASAKQLEVSAVGYIQQLVEIGNRNSIDVFMEADVKLLNNVVVTGYTNYTRSKSVSAASVVGADKINEVPMSTFDQVLQGRVPGLVISSVSGQPGTSANVMLRGVGTINGSSSVLYVVDGVPIENGYFQTINPADIETVTVLKDASAKAQYGSRGSNGVIVVTTKKGKAGKLNLQYNSQYGFSNQTSPRFRSMNAAEHLQFEEEIGLETGSNIGPGWEYSKKNPDYASKSPQEQQRADDILDSLRSHNTDWRKIFFRQGKFMEQQISASGGNENVRFYNSLNYYNEKGIAVRSDLERFTLKSNVDFNYGKLTANMNVNLGYSNSSFIPREGSSNGRNPLSAVYYALPYEYPYAPDGTLVNSDLTDEYPVLDEREGSNSLEYLLNTSSKTNQYKTIISSSINYNITPELVAKTRFGVDFRESLDQDFIRPDSYYGRRVSNGRQGSFGEGLRRNFYIITTSGLSYSKLIADRHDLEVSGYFEYSANNYKSFNYTGYGIESRLPETPAGITPGSDENGFIADLGGRRTKNALTSYMAFGRYTLDGKYTININYRYDGSSTVPLNNRWHGFYSAGLGWEVTKENFMQNIDAIPLLRLRSSYGTTASPFRDDYTYLATYGTVNYGGSGGIVATQPGNANFDWEYAKEFNAGLDLALLKSRRIRLTADYYNRVTSNLFLEKPISSTSGFDYLYLNVGSMRNRGVELDIQGDVIKAKQLTWTLGANFSYNKNEVTDLGGLDEFESGYTGIVRVGLPYGSHYAPKWAGVDPATGNPLYYDKDGKTTENYNASTLSVAEFGTYFPAITGGFNTSLNWNNFYLNALFSFATQVYRYNNEDYYNENPSFITSNQSTRMLYNRWKKPGDIAELPRIGAKRSYSSKDIQDASYLRLRNVNMGYSLPQEWLQSVKAIQGIKVFVQAQNLLTWTKWKGFDPENGNEYAVFNYPAARTYTFGLNVNF